MRGKETLWKQIRTLWTVLLMAVLFVGAVQVKAGGNPEEGTTQGGSAGTDHYDYAVY